MINVQCVYGNDDKKHVEDCIIPNLAATTREKINFLCLNYEHGETIGSFENENLRVMNVPGKIGKHGFGENHNHIFKSCPKTSSFVLINPDCIPLPHSIDMLLDRKKNDTAIVEGRQWPFEHPKEYDPLTFETPWASFAFCLIDSDFYEQASGMDKLFFLYCEDVDLSWRAWLSGWKVIYEPKAQVIHFTDGYFPDRLFVSNEQYFSLRNFLLLARKFFGEQGESRALALLNEAVEPALLKKVVNDYYSNIVPHVTIEFAEQKHEKIKITGINQYAALRDME